MVVHEVPVAKAIAPEVTKTSAGRRNIGNSMFVSSPERYPAVPTSWVTAPRDHASVRITIAIIIALTPPTQASMHSFMSSSRCETDSAAATRHPAREPQRRVLKGSAAPKMSRSDASAPAAARPVV